MLPKFCVMAFVAAASSCVAASLYSNDFESGDTSGWSAGGIVQAPNASTNFLGLFSRNSQTVFTQSGLTLGSTVYLGFDLYANNSWDGNNLSFGPDIFTVDVVSGPILLQTTFSNTAFPGFGQSYPSAWNPGLPVDNAPGTGAAALNSLGFPSNDATYRLVFPVLVTAPTMSFRFSGLNLQDAGDENWGLDNLSISTEVPEPLSAGLVILGLGLAAVYRRR